MLTLVLLCALMTSQGVQAWGTTGWGITASPSCRNNCGGYFGYCDCTYSCLYYGNCCWDFHTYCSSAGTTVEQTPGGITEGQTTESPSCENACGHVFGSCSCSYRCESRGNCCKDYYPFCVGTTYAPQTTTLETTPNPYDTAATHDYTCWHNCEHDMAMCSCSYRCEYYGNCCYDYYAFCVGTTAPDPAATTQGGSCWNNCGRDLGVCSCSYGCQYRGDCCHDYNWYCPITTYEPHTTPGNTPGYTVGSSCRRNCGSDLWSCSCASSCERRGNCCGDYYSYCYYPTTYSPSYTTGGRPSCRNNCWQNFGSCSCSSSCKNRGNCCWDYDWYCPITTYEPHTPTPGGSCGGSLSGSGSFTSPNYPSDYHNHAYCNWQLRTSSDQTLRLFFTTVMLENCCNCDNIMVYDGPSVNSRILGKVCGYSSNNNNTPSFSSSSNYLTVVFRSDHSVVRRGFSAVFTSSLSEPSCRNNCGQYFGNCTCSSSCKHNGECCSDYDLYCSATTNAPHTGTPGYTEEPSCRRNCGNNFWSCSCASSCERRGNCCRDYYSYCYYPTTYSPSYTTGGGSCGGSLSGSGSVSSPNYPYNYNNHDYCNWQIQTSPGQTLYLVFTFLELEHCCNCDYILVYDGPSVNSRLLGKVCDDGPNNNNATASFHSSSNYLTVVFRSDGSVVASGFNAEFTSSLSPSSGRVDCSSDNMNIVVSKSYLNSLGIDAHNLYLNDQYCRPDITYYNVVFNFPINTCGTVREFEHGRIVYTNALRSFPSSYGEITRQSVYKLGVSCRMEEDSFSQIIYEVKHSENVSISGSGRYNTSMSFYTSSSFYYEVTQVPYLVRLNQNLYVQVSLRRGDSALVLFLDTCVASPSPHDFQTRSYDLIRNGCRVDSSFYTYSSGTRPYARFRFKAFQFLRATEHVYIQCKVLICPASDYNSRCRRGCVRRKVRDLESEHHSETVVLGPIQLLEEDKGAEEAEPETKG